MQSEHERVGLGSLVGSYISCAGWSGDDAPVVHRSPADACRLKQSRRAQGRGGSMRPISVLAGLAPAPRLYGGEGADASQEEQPAERK